MSEFDRSSSGDGRYIAVSPAKTQYFHRVVARLTGRFILEMLGYATRLHGGDTAQAVIFTAIWSENVSHVMYDEAFSGSVVPDLERRPVTVSRLSKITSMPPETVRRHVNKMIKMGLCHRQGGKGVIVPSRVLEGPDMIDAAFSTHSASIEYAVAMSRILSRQHFAD